MAASTLALALFLTAVVSMLSPTVRSDVAVSPVNVPTSRPPLSVLAMRLQLERSAFVRDGAGQVVTVFGLPVADVRVLLLPVNRHRALPVDYEPPDLARYGGRWVRASILPDLTAMVQGAAADGVELAAISGYRSPDEQALAFQSAVWRAVARETGDDGRPIDVAEAEARSARFVAPPGHSQHQLGTAIDFSSWEINYALQPRFAETDSGRWLEQHAWEYGFVLPYARNGEERSGYAYEPWHFRWVGRDLAAVLQHDNYQSHPTLIVDDYLRATEELLAFEGVP